MSIKVEETLKFMVEETLIEPTKIRDFIKRFGTQEIRLLLNFCQQNVGKDLPKKNYGLVHQDLVNILGERIGFKVTFGDYQKGADGIWSYKDVSLVIESKTSPTWLEIKQASDYVKDEKATSGLIICPDFTEDNIKAAGGYGNVRLLTTDGLCRLAELKDEGLVSTEDIVGMLIPQETVKLDYLVDIIYKVRTKPKEIIKEKPEEEVIESRFVERARRGETTPQTEYTLPILETLIEMGGSGRMSDVLDRVYGKMKDRLTPKDLEKLPSGTSIRWKNRAQWERQRLKSEGYLKKDSPFGIWEITEEGRKLYESLKES